MGLFLKVKMTEKTCRFGQFVVFLGQKCQSESFAGVQRTLMVGSEGGAVGVAFAPWRLRWRGGAAATRNKKHLDSSRNAGADAEPASAPHLIYANYAIWRDPILLTASNYKTEFIPFFLRD